VPVEAAGSVGAPPAIMPPAAEERLAEPPAPAPAEERAPAAAPIP